jgi:hypothetical protein
MHGRLIVVLLTLAAMPAAAQVGMSREALLGGMYLARDYEFERIVSNPTAGPDGGNVLKPGEVREVADIRGPGVISHIWFTLSRQTDYVLKDCVLRIYWDGEKEPSVEVPIGEFFGLGHGKYYDVRSLPFETGNRRGYNCFLPMPFRKSCRITFTNSPTHELRRLFYHINYKRVKSLPADALYFHAQYRQAKPVSGGNYTILEARGRGHFVGLFYYNRTNAPGWWGDGGEQVTVDGRAVPGTGQEDYFGQGWSFGKGESGLRFGSPLYESGEKPELADNSFYRFHIEDPIPFLASFSMTMKHGMQNERADDYSTVAFWYQSEPHMAFPKLPPADKRYPSRPDASVSPEAAGAGGTGIPSQAIE